VATTLYFIRELCRFGVTTSIRFQNLASELGAAELDALLDQWDKHTLEVWNRGSGAKFWKECFVVFVSAWAKGGIASGFHYVQIQGGEPFWDSTYLGPQSTVGVWHFASSGFVAAHEVGHFLGLGDEYGYDAGGAYVNLNPQPAGQPQSIMAQTWDEVAALPEHVDGVLGTLGAVCPGGCARSLFARIKDTFLPEFLRGERLRRGIPVASPRLPPGPRPPVTPHDPLEGRPIDQIFAAIETGRPHEMIRGVEALVAAGPPVTATLRKNLTHAHALRRWACATALGRLADATAAPALLAATTDTVLGVRLAAAVSLLQLHDTGGIPALLDALASDDVAIGHPPRLAREYAHIALRHWTKRDFGFDSKSAGFQARRGRRALAELVGDGGAGVQPPLIAAGAAWRRRSPSTARGATTW